MIISTAFLGLEMKCARCHDAPYHDATQEQLFQLGAMLAIPKPLLVHRLVQILEWLRECSRAVPRN